MPMQGFRGAAWILAGWAALASPGRAEWEWGGCLVPGHNQNLRFTAGAVLEFEGMVAETTRKLYDVTGNTWKQSLAESYGTSDFNLDGPYGTLGLSLDMAWTFVRFQADSTFVQPSTTATARRDYYIAVGEDIEYNGQSYDHLMIPQGARFSADLTGNMTELNLLLVPVGFKGGDILRINPSLDVGLLLFGGSYEIDAGETTGVKTYQNPPEDFAIGGRSSGFTILGAPQWGPGVEVRLGKPDGVQVDLQVHYLFANYDGSTGWLTTANHREKNLDFDHENLRLRGQVEIPLKRAALNIGVQAQFIETDGTVSAKAGTPEEVLELQERFDKDFSFKMDSVMGTVGITF